MNKIQTKQWKRKKTTDLLTEIQNEVKTVRIFSIDMAIFANAALLASDVLTFI